jgi:hypothetical protein
VISRRSWYTTSVPRGHAIENDGPETPSTIGTPGFENDFSSRFISFVDMHTNGVIYLSSVAKEPLENSIHVIRTVGLKSLDVTHLDKKVILRNVIGYRKGPVPR